jgi:hypothetical protein
VQPTFPAVFISTEQNHKQFLFACGGERDEPTVLLRQYMTCALRGALVVDTVGNAFSVTKVELAGINWHWVFLGGPVTGIVVFLIQVLTLSVPVKVRASYLPATPVSLSKFKSMVLERMAFSTSNFMGGGNASQWRAPVNTATSFSQVIDRLCLHKSTA